MRLKERESVGDCDSVKDGESERERERERERVQQLPASAVSVCGDPPPLSSLLVACRLAVHAWISSREEAVWMNIFNISPVLSTFLEKCA